MQAIKLLPMVDQAFARALRQLRTDKGLSQEALGLEAGLHRTYVSQLERGLKSPSLKTLYKIALVLNVNLVELMSLVQREIEDVSSDGR